MSSKLFTCCLLLSMIISLELKSQQFTLVDKNIVVTIVYDRNGPALDSIAAVLLAEDIKMVSGTYPVILNDLTRAKGNVILIGNMQSENIRNLIGTSVHDSLAGKWECFGMKVLHKPTKKINQMLVIAGSDERGTAYGVFALSGKIGISPWYWWADVKPERKPVLRINQPDSVSKSPSVKYRGIFINDEDWGLRPWAAQNFEREYGNIGPKTYAKVFELLLRLRANLIWPAMHPGTRPFYEDSMNRKTAMDYAIIIGSSHAEPMLRNNVGEWKKEDGEFNYITNQKKIIRYWEDRVKESMGTEVMYSMGMRGVHDSGIEGVKNNSEAVPLLERIISDQRHLLSTYVNPDSTRVPQAFTAYKEVLDIYDLNLKLPEDITLVWPDDNYGYIQRLNNDSEKKRSGGSGVYYHASYWGRPHDYLWLSSTHPALIREEMIKAWQNGSDRIWVLNVGDIKPLEYNIQLFLDMAFNTAPFQKPEYSKTHLLNWIRNNISKTYSTEIENILWNYFQLAFERRPEFMGWSQTEPTTPTRLTGFNHYYFGDEADRRISSYDKLEKSVRELRRKIPADKFSSFYELVYYPVVSASWMNKKFLFRDKSILYAKQNRNSSNDYKDSSEQMHQNILKETAYYNLHLEKGKWNHIMSMNPRSLPVFELPSFPEFKINEKEGWDLTVEGEDSVVFENRSNNGYQKSLPLFQENSHEGYFIDIFLTGNKSVAWHASAPDWIWLSRSGGTLIPDKNKSQQRIWVNVKWSKIPASIINSAKIIFSSASKKITVDLKVQKIAGLKPKSTKYFIESKGYLSMFAQHASRFENQSVNGWRLLEGLGHTGASLESSEPARKISLSDPDTASVRKNVSAVFEFYSFTETIPEFQIICLPTHPVNKEYSVRCAVSVDGGPIQILDFRTFGRSEEWKQNVLRNYAERKFKGSYLKKGLHQLRIYAVDPGLILDRIMIDLGGLKNVYGVVPETIW